MLFITPQVVFRTVNCSQSGRKYLHLSSTLRRIEVVPLHVNRRKTLRVLLQRLHKRRKHG